MPLIPVEVGQVRIDPDPRTEGKRTVTVERVNGPMCYAVTNKGRRTRIGAYDLSRWPLVTAATTTEPS